MTTAEMLNKKFTYAVVGASNNETKFGYQVLMDLHDAGYQVVPINLHEDKVMGLKAYHKISDYPGSFDVVVFVVPPAATEEVLKEVKQKGIKNVWMQPGAESEKALAYCKENRINCVNDDCIMVRRNKEVS